MNNKNESNPGTFKTAKVSKSNHLQRFSQIKLLTGRLRSIKQLSLSKFKRVQRKSDSCASQFRSQINPKQMNRTQKDGSKCSIANEKEVNTNRDIQWRLRDRKKTFLGQGKVAFQNMSEQKQSLNLSLRSNKMNCLKQSLKSSKNLIKQKFKRIKQSSTSLWNLDSSRQVDISRIQNKIELPQKGLLEKQIHQFDRLVEKLKQILQSIQRQKIRQKTLGNLIDLITKQKQEMIKNSSHKILASACFPTQIEDNVFNSDDQYRSVQINQRSHKKLLKLKQFQIQSLQKQIHLIIKATNQNLAKLKTSKEQVLAFRKQRVMFSCFNKNIQKQIKKEQIYYMKLMIENQNKLLMNTSIQPNGLFQKVKAIFNKASQQQKKSKTLKIINEQNNIADDLIEAQSQCEEKQDTLKSNSLSFYAQSKKKVMISLRNKNKDKNYYFHKNQKSNYNFIKDKIESYQTVIHKVYNQFSVTHSCQLEGQQQVNNKQIKTKQSFILLENQQKYNQKNHILNQETSNIARIRQKVINLKSKNNIISDKIKKYDDFIINYQQNVHQSKQNQQKLHTKWLYQDQSQEENSKIQIQQNSIKESKHILSQIKDMFKENKGQSISNQKQQLRQDQFISKVTEIQRVYCHLKLIEKSEKSCLKTKKSIKQKINTKRQNIIQSQAQLDNLSVNKSICSNILKKRAQQNCNQNDILFGQQTLNKQNIQNNQDQVEDNINFQLQKLKKQRPSVKDKSINQIIEGVASYENSHKIMNRRQFQKQYFKEVQRNVKKKKNGLIKKAVFCIF